MLKTVIGGVKRMKKLQSVRSFSDIEKKLKEEKVECP